MHGASHDIRALPPLDAETVSWCFKNIMQHHTSKARRLPRKLDLGISERLRLRRNIKMNNIAPVTRKGFDGTSYASNVTKRRACHTKGHFTYFKAARK
jgi:hypothetical protein